MGAGEREKETRGGWREVEGNGILGLCGLRHTPGQFLVFLLRRLLLHLKVSLFTGELRLPRSSRRFVQEQF